METNSENGRLVPFMATHPGEVLQAELQERGLKQKDFAAAIGMHPSHLSALIHGKRNITADIALRFEQQLQIPAQSWLNLQSGYELDVKAIATRNHRENTKSLMERIDALERKMDQLIQLLQSQTSMASEPEEKYGKK